MILIHQSGAVGIVVAALLGLLGRTLAVSAGG
eukprot:COSAG06_NODE_59961_length_272_cov_0.976879_2_plen_31_part_01